MPDIVRSSMSTSTNRGIFGIVALSAYVAAAVACSSGTRTLPDAMSTPDSGEHDGSNDVASPDSVADVHGSSNGTSCGAAAECKSGNCADGVCCDMPCNELDCRACNIAGSIGSCVYVPSGSDPHGTCQPTSPETCGRDGQCDGQGKCRLFVAGVSCSVNGGKCDGFGQCK